MSRSNSKYFASVIAKLIAAKRQERINVDDKLKQDLRLEVLQRAQDGVWRESPDFFEPTFGERVLDFFRRWRAVMIAIPSVFVLILVATQISKLPLFFKTDTVTPVVDQGGEVTGGTETNGGEGSGSGEKIKTFPGALVMPQTAPEQSQLKMEAPASAYEQKPSTGQTYSKAPATYKAPTSSTAASQSSYSTQGGVYAPPAPTTSYPYAPNPYTFFVPDRTGNFSSNDSQDDMVSSHRELRWSGDEEPVDLNRSYTTPVYTPSYTAPVMAASPETVMTMHDSYPVYYKNFYGQNTTELQNKVLTNVAESKNVSSVVFDRGENQVVKVDVFYKDGRSVVNFYYLPGY